MQSLLPSIIYEEVELPTCLFPSRKIFQAWLEYLLQE